MPVGHVQGLLAKQAGMWPSSDTGHITSGDLVLFVEHLARTVQQTQRAAVPFEPRFEPQHVSNTLWACARMQLQEPLMIRALTARAIEDIQRFCPLDISICR